MRAKETTWCLATQLYEGIDLGNKELLGLITYYENRFKHVSQKQLNMRLVLTSLEAYGTEYIGTEKKKETKK